MALILNLSGPEIRLILLSGKTTLTVYAYCFIVRYMSKNRNDRLVEFAEIFKALSNPNRLRIFVRLASCCAPGTVSLIDEDHTAYVGELSNELDVGKSTVSHHIKELRRVGLLRTERRGQKIACWVDPERVNALMQFFVFEPVVQLK